MDPVRRQRCETCAFHQTGPTSSTGLCTNPIWQPIGGVARFVRDRELACYSGWGLDSWKQRPGPLPPLPVPANGSGGTAGGSGGRSTSGGIIGRYGTMAGGRIVQLRLIDPASPSDLLIDEVTGSGDAKSEEREEQNGVDHTN